MQLELNAGENARAIWDKLQLNRTLLGISGYKQCKGWRDYFNIYTVLNKMWVKCKEAHACQY